MFYFKKTTRYFCYDTLLIHSAAEIIFETSFRKQI